MEGEPEHCYTFCFICFVADSNEDVAFEVEVHREIYFRIGVGAVRFELRVAFLF